MNMSLLSSFTFLYILDLTISIFLQVIVSDTHVTAFTTLKKILASSRMPLVKKIPHLLISLLYNALLRLMKA